MADKDLATLPPYTTVDFQSLANQDEAFKSLWENAQGRLDFRDPSITVTLAKAILKTDFNLVLDIPDDRLCPPIPNRFNYVSWIQNLIDTTSPDYNNDYDPERSVTGLDIGTGASAIYTLLLLQTRPNWSMCGTEIDKKSFNSAVLNLTLNNLVTRAKLLQTLPSNPLIPLQHLNVANLDFTICNPPFFSSAAEMRASLRGAGKAAAPNAICTGAEVEMVCPGGDVGFVTRLVEESLELRDKVQWYTSLLGKLDSAKAIVALLKRHGIDNWAVGVVDVGAQTKRWVVGWSFGDRRPRQHVARLDRIANEFLPFPTEFRVGGLEGVDGAGVAARVEALLAPLELLCWRWDGRSGVGEARENVWNRAYRHKKKKREEGVGEAAGGGRDVEMGGEEGKGKVAIAFRVSVVMESGEVVAEWLRGTDQVLWESFCGMLHRGLKKP